MKPTIADQLARWDAWSDSLATTAEPITTGHTRVTPQGLTQWYCPECYQWVGVRLIPLINDRYHCMWCAGRTK